MEVAEAEELFNFPLHPYTHSLISAIPIPDPQLEKNKVLYTYDPSIHDYSEDKPEFVNIGHDHYVYGNKKEIEEYKKLREKDEPLQPITIRKPGEKVEETAHEVHLSKAEDEFLKTPVHDTGSIWYTSTFLLPADHWYHCGRGLQTQTVLSQLQGLQKRRNYRLYRYRCDPGDLPAGTASGCHKVAIWGGRSKIRILGDRSRSKKSNFRKSIFICGYFW